MILAWAIAFLAGGGPARAGNMPGWSAPTVQPSATQRQLKRVTPSHRTGNRLQPAAMRSHPRVSQFQTWEQLWGAVWRSSRASAPVQAAATVRSHSICQGDMNSQIDSIVVQTVRAINARKNGDAARLLAQFQDKLLCLDVKSMWTLDFLMAAFMANASMLPSQQRNQAVKGMLNMMLLVFDQIQYTGRSYSLPVLFHMRGHVQRALANYSGHELGLWFYDYQSGAMQRYTFDQKQPQFSNGLMKMISVPARFANGACSITEMVGQGFKCGGIPGSKSGGGGGGMPASAGGQLACMTAAASMSGVQGQMRCMVRSGGGGNSVGSWMSRARPSINMRGVLDGFCSGTTSEPPTPKVYEENPAEHSESGLCGPGTVCRAAVNIWESVGSWLSGSSSDSSSGETASSGGSGRQLTEEQKRKLDDFSAADDAEDRRINREVEEWRKRTDPTRAGGASGMSAESSGCGASTNAVARANRLFSCTGTGGGRPGSSGPLTGQNAPGARSMPAPGSSGGGGGMSGLMACAVQGGSLVRMSMNDRRCQQSMCAPGQSCSCNGGGGSAPAAAQEQVQRTIFSPNRANIGARDPRPDSGVGGAPRWGGAGGPVTGPFGGRGPTGGR